MLLLNSEVSQEMADIYAFLFAQLGMTMTP
jgi:hypothetical protein